MFYVFKPGAGWWNGRGWIAPRSVAHAVRVTHEDILTNPLLYADYTQRRLILLRHVYKAGLLPTEPAYAFGTGGGGWYGDEWTRDTKSVDFKSVARLQKLDVRSYPGYDVMYGSGFAFTPSDVIETQEAFFAAA